MVTENIQNPTQEEIDGWKKKYGDIFKIKVADKIAYLKKPSRKALGYSFSAKDPIKAKEIILIDCWVGGNVEMLQDDAYFLALAGKVDEMIEVKEAELEKL